MNQMEKQLKQIKQKIKLVSPHYGDVVVLIDDINISLTHSSLVEGEPKLSLNKSDLVYGASLCPQSIRPIVLIGDYGINDDVTLLPTHTLNLYLTSDLILMDDNAHGSHLVVKMMMDFDFDKSILNQIRPFLKQINWHRQARDFYL